MTAQPHPEPASQLTDPLLAGLTRDTATPLQDAPGRAWRPDGLPVGLLAVGTTTPARWPGTQCCGDCGCPEVAHHRRHNRRTFCTARIPGDDGNPHPCGCMEYALPRWLCLIADCPTPVWTGRDSRQAQDACMLHQSIDHPPTAGRAR